jgi:hypothetical protein
MCFSSDFFEIFICILTFKFLFNENGILKKKNLGALNALYKLCEVCGYFFFFFYCHPAIFYLQTPITRWF